MSSAVVSALIKFSTTLSDDKVDYRSKLRVLGTLNEVTLTLNELSESGVGRAVRRLKSEPGNLGRTAKTLVTKWKNLLKNHIAKESLTLPIEPDEVLENKSDSCNNSQHFPSFSEKLSHVSDKISPKSDIITKESSCAINNSELSTAVPKKMWQVPINSDAMLIGENVEYIPAYSGKKSDLKSGKRKYSGILDCVDSSSGLSFMESLTVGSLVHQKKRKRKQINKAHSNASTTVNSSLTSDIRNKTSAAFTASVLSSLAEDVERPDAVYTTLSDIPITLDGTASVLDDDEGDGNLKFKSKRVLWMPKPGRTHHPLGNVGNCSSQVDPVNGICESRNMPARLTDICLEVVQRNLSRVDQVGEVPYELLVNVLRHADAEDLARIEYCNPQFEGCSEKLWQKHVQLKFHGGKDTQPLPKESWRDLYVRLSQEQNKKLDEIIHHSAQRIKENLQSRRTTLTTEVITPRQFKPRGNRMPSSLTKSHKPSSSDSSNTAKPEYRKPYNASRTSDSRSAAPTGVRTPCSSRSTPTINSANGNLSLLNKLRKQFQTGRLR